MIVRAGVNPLSEFRETGRNEVQEGWERKLGRAKEMMEAKEKRKEFCRTPPSPGGTLTPVPECRYSCSRSLNLSAILSPILPKNLFLRASSDINTRSSGNSSFESSMTDSARALMFFMYALMTVRI
jgi:hypothetical protein